MSQLEQILGKVLQTAARLASAPDEGSMIALDFELDEQLLALSAEIEQSPNMFVHRLQDGRFALKVNYDVEG